MDSSNDDESSIEPPEPVAPIARFTDTEDHQIEMWAEAIRRSKDVDLVVEAAVEAKIEPTTTALMAFEGTCGPDRKNVLSFIVASWQRIGGGMLSIIALWLIAFYVPGRYFEVKAGSQESTNIILICVAVTALIAVVVFLLEIHSFKLWTNWRLEVSDSEVIISQTRSFIGRVDENRISLRRGSVEFVEVSRKWYLWFLNIYTVSFDAPTGEDTAFHDLRFIKNGKLIKELFTHKQG